jgi:hypothetical protein
MFEMFIRGNVPSKKNTQIVTAGKRLVSSPTVVKWQKESNEDWVKYRQVFKDITKGRCPLFIHLTFIRNSERLFDFIAPTETVADEMVRMGFLSDDNIYEFVPHFGKPRIDKKSPGVIIKVLASPPKYEYL